MESFRIDIVNPKAKRIIKDLADLNLISIWDKDPIKPTGASVSLVPKH